MCVISYVIMHCTAQRAVNKNTFLEFNVGQLYVPVGTLAWVYNDCWNSKDT